MGAFVPYFDYDVFVSYAHVDNQPQTQGDPESGWVHTLVDNLKRLLAQKLGRTERGKIWIDRRLTGNEPFSEGIRQAVGRSATLLVILSEGYLESDWCRQERDLFLEASEQRGRTAKGRIFIVRQTVIDHTR